MALALSGQAKWLLYLHRLHPMAIKLGHQGLRPAITSPGGQNNQLKNDKKTPHYLYFCTMHKWISQLEILLAKELPGTSAHVKMTPNGRIDTESYLLSTSTDVRTSAVMIVLFPEEEVLKMVLIKRPSYDGVHSGQISFPGGKSEETDSDYVYTALRETEEEVGIRADKIQLLGSLSRIYIPPSNFLVYPYVGYCAHPPSFRLDQKEVEKIILPPVDILLNDEIIKQGSFKAGGPNGWQINAPYFEVENERIWGATAAILSELKELLLTIKPE